MPTGCSTRCWAIGPRKRRRNGSTRPIGKVFGDLTGDGKLDLVITDYKDGLVRGSLGNGDGTFQVARWCAGMHCQGQLARLRLAGRLGAPPGTVMHSQANGVKWK